MSYEGERAAIEDRWNTQWAGATQTKYDNVPFTPPANTTWVELQIHNGESFNASIGDQKMVRSTGVISINIHSPQGTGTALARQLADTAAQIFRNQDFSSVQCRAARILRVGEQDGYFIYNVSVPFKRDEIFS